MKEKQVVQILNKMLKCCEPVYYEEFNRYIPANNKKKLMKYEKDHPQLGIATYKTKNENGDYIYDTNKIGISTLSIIATITDIFCDKRLAAVIETQGKDKGKILKFAYAKYTEI